MAEWYARQSKANLAAYVVKMETDLAAAHAEIERLRSLMIEAKQRLSYDAETFHDQGCWDREDACLAIMKRIDAALALPLKHADREGGV